MIGIGELMLVILVLGIPIVIIIVVISVLSKSTKVMEETEAMQIKELTKDMDKNQKVSYYEQKKKSAGIATLLSFIIPGAGQMYLGRVGKGILILIFCWLIIPWLYGIYDAYKTANDYNARLYSIIFSEHG
ncbi:MAG: TM2 domain-containing protein [archaeon]|nr:TM2 domain-containing protein [archaeon]